MQGYIKLEKANQSSPLFISAGAISAIYIGLKTDEAPIAKTTNKPGNEQDHPVWSQRTKIWRLGKEQKPDSYAIIFFPPGTVQREPEKLLPAHNGYSKL